MRLAWIVGWTALIVVVGGVSAKERPPEHWGPQFSTPGVQLDVREVDRIYVEDAGMTVVTYALVPSGVPEESMLSIWGRGWEGEITLLGTGFSVNDSGELFCPGPPEGQEPTPRALRKASKKSLCYTFEGFEDEFVFGAAGFLRGQPYEFAVTSADRAIQAFAKAVPFPIEGRDGQCRIWIEQSRPDVFSLYFEGFRPNEELTITSRSVDEGGQGKVTFPEDGKLVIVVLPQVEGHQKGLATISVAGESCHPGLEYEWGELHLRTTP